MTKTYNLRPVQVAVTPLDGFVAVYRLSFSVDAGDFHVDLPSLMIREGDKLGLEISHKDGLLTANITVTPRAPA